MDSISWGVVLAVGFISGATGALLHARRAALLNLAALSWHRLRQRVRSLRRRPKRQGPVAVRPRERRTADDVVVLIPDGRPWPLGPALHLLELAWRWQVVHGTNLPLRARQGEGAYVWRPPLPARTSANQPGAEAER